MSNRVNRDKSSSREQFAQKRLLPGRTMRRIFFVALWGILALTFFPQTFFGITRYLFSSKNVHEYEYIAFKDMPEFEVTESEQTENIQNEVGTGNAQQLREEMFGRLDEIELQLDRIRTRRFSASLEYVDFTGRDQQKLLQQSGPHSPGRRLVRYMKGQFDQLHQTWDGFSRKHLNFSLPSISEHLESLGGSSGSDDAIYFPRPVPSGFTRDGFASGLSEAFPWIENYAQSDVIIEDLLQDLSLQD